eukprot:1388112-Pleurochrysis_carterae.AAC.2
MADKTDFRGSKSPGAKGSTSRSGSGLAQTTKPPSPRSKRSSGENRPRGHWEGPSPSESQNNKNQGNPELGEPLVDFKRRCEPCPFIQHLQKPESRRNTYLRRETQRFLSEFERSMSTLTLTHLRGSRPRAMPRRPRQAVPPS